MAPGQRRMRAAFMHYNDVYTLLEAAPRFRQSSAAISSLTLKMTGTNDLKPMRFSPPTAISRCLYIRFCKKLNADVRLDNNSTATRHFLYYRQYSMPAFCFECRLTMNRLMLAAYNYTPAPRDDFRY